MAWIWVVWAISLPFSLVRLVRTVRLRRAATASQGGRA
jgi:hypothetical protein